MVIMLQPAAYPSSAMEVSDIESKSADARVGALALLSSVGLGVDCDSTHLACETQLANLPPGWSQHVDEFGVAFYYNQFSDESTWVHPRSEMLVELHKIVKHVKDKQDPPSERFCRISIEEHLESVQLRAAEEISQWAGPYMHSGEAYYYNTLTDTSSWVSPVEMWEDDLRSRAQVLSGCLLRDASKRDELLPRADIPGTSREAPSASIEERPSTPNDSCTHVSMSSASQGSHCVQGVPHVDEDQTASQTFEICTHVPSEASVPASSHCLHSETEVLIHEFRNDPEQSVLEFPPTLSAMERKAAKAMADRYGGLRCESFGYGTERHLLIFKEKGASPPGDAAIVGADVCAQCRWASPEDFTFGKGSLEDFTFGKAEPLSIPDCQAITMLGTSDKIALENLTPKFGKRGAFDCDSPPSPPTAV